jgi:hypothetical protein
MVQNDLLVRIWRIAYGMVWYGVVWRGMAWYGWMTGRACGERLFERDRGGAVWDGLEPASEAAGAKSRGAACIIMHGLVGWELAVRDGLAKVRESWS